MQEHILTQEHKSITLTPKAKTQFEQTLSIIDKELALEEQSRLFELLCNTYVRYKTFKSSYEPKTDKEKLRKAKVALDAITQHCEELDRVRKVLAAFEPSKVDPNFQVSHAIGQLTYVLKAASRDYSLLLNRSPGTWKDKPLCALVIDLLAIWVNYLELEPTRSFDKFALSCLQLFKTISRAETLTKRVC